MLAIVQLATKLVPKPDFPWDKTLTHQSYGQNLIGSILIIGFIALIGWIVKLAFEEKRD